MRLPVFLLFLSALVALVSCDKAKLPADPDPVFEIVVKNEYLEVQAKYAAFISDADGEILAFRWLPGDDTTRLQVPGSSPNDRFDCTIVQLATLEAPGTGVRDTTLNLTTYTQVASGQRINLRDLFYHQVTTLRFQLTGFNTLDSIVVPDGLTLMRPQAINNYHGEYLVSNTGMVWFRVLINGEKFWRFLVFKNAGPLIEAHTIDASALLSSFAPPLEMEFPFTTRWDYTLDGVVDTARYQFFPLSPPYRVPGAPIPVFNFQKIIEPVNNDLFEPNRPYINLFRLQAKGLASTTDGYTYYCDRFFEGVPSVLSEPDFDLSPTTGSSNARFAAVRCEGSFDVLSLTRSRSGNPNINWEVFLKPEQGIVVYRLPDVPNDLGDRFPALRNYEFATSVRARAEWFDRLDYDAAQRNRMLNADPLWRAKAGYMGREEAY